MKAIFDRWCTCVGWLDENSLNVFSANLEWIGFVKNTHLFSPNTIWLGALVNGTFIDKVGKPVAWLQGSHPRGYMQLIRPIKPIIPIRPIRPIKPLTPLRPLKPLTPIGGWSSLNWNDYISGRC